MTIDIRPLRGREVGAALDVAEQTPRLTVPDLPELRDVSLTGTLTLTGEGLVLAGELAAAVEQTCARCAKTFDLQIKTRLTELYREQPEDDDEAFRYEGDQINLDPLVRATVLTNVPAAPLHDPDCRGLCPVCGKDLNEEPHTHAQDGSESPFAALKNLKP